MRGHLTLLLVAAIVCSCEKRSNKPSSFDPEQAAAKASLLEERPVTIHSKPVFRKDSGITWLEASEGEVHVYEVWAYEGETPPVELDPNTTYEFDVLEQPYVTDPSLAESDGVGWIATIVRILDGERLIFDASICSLHEVPMKRQTVPIHYGLPSYPTGFLEARKERFPNANPHEEGGCSPDHNKTSRVFQCERCKTEQQAWKVANPKR